MRLSPFELWLGPVVATVFVVTIIALTKIFG